MTRPEKSWINVVTQRHPTSKLHKTQQDIRQLEENQQDVLAGLILKPIPSKEEALQVNVLLIRLTKSLIWALHILLDCNPLCT